jgi:hypothetical protein
MTDEVQVVVRNGDGEDKIYVGLEVSRGPAMMHLILTRPYPVAGRTIDIPCEQVVSVARMESTPQGVPISEIEQCVIDDSLTR